MTTHTKPLSSPKDNLLGICNALGEDFSFNPLWLRLALGVAFVIQPLGVVVGYLALGLVVLVSRLAFPDARKSKQAVEAMPAVAAAPHAAAAQDDEQVFAKAA